LLQLWTGAAVPFQRFTVEIGSGDPGGFGLLMRCQLKLPIQTVTTTRTKFAIHAALAFLSQSFSRSV
jgi:hypothetical protein